MALLGVVALITGAIGCGDSEDSREEGTVSRGQSGPMPDPNLRLAVRTALNIGAQAGPVTTTEIGMLKILHARKESYTDSIEDLTGLEFATDLIRLELDGNNVSDISPLAGMTRLMELDLSGNQITDITPLAGLTELGRLNLTENERIKDTAPLCELKTIEIEGVELNCGGLQFPPQMMTHEKEII